MAPGHLPAHRQHRRGHRHHHDRRPGPPGREHDPRRQPHRAPVTPGELPPAPAVHTGPAQVRAGRAGSEGVLPAAGRAGRRRTAAAGLPGRRLPPGGVYISFEDAEVRSDGSSRVVRVRTHALTAASSATLRDRLRQHRGHPGRPRSRQRQPPGPGIPAARRGGAHPPRRAATGTARILARPPRPAPGPGPPGNRSRNGRQPPHRSHAGAVAGRPGPRHPRRRRAEQHLDSPPAWPTARTSPAPAGSGTTPSPARSASPDCGTPSTSPDPADPASWPPSTS